MNYLVLLASFGAGVFGAVMGGVASFVMVGLIALAGSAAAMAGGTDIATAVLAFGTVFGPHISFTGSVTAAAYAGRKGYLSSGGSDIMTALHGLNKPDVLLVGGVTGVAGFLIQWFYANVCHFNTDTVAMTVATLGILTRLLVGKSGLFGTYEDGERRAVLTADHAGSNLILALSIGFIVSGTGIYMLETYPQMAELITANYANIFFSISALTFVLMMTIPGASTPPTHHITITTANAVMLSGNFFVGVVTALVAAFLADMFGNVKAEELNAPILATLKDYAEVSRQSRYIATVPGLSIKKLLDKNNLTLDDVDLIEVNEAFAAVPLVSCLGILGMDQKTMDEKVNVNGGAVAVGHPIGATGARILMTLTYELKRSGKKSGIAAICSGMAQGDAVWIEVE